MLIKLKDALKVIAGDRLMIGLLVATVVLALLLLAFVLLTVRPGEVQVVTHYTAFGPTNFYRSSWAYLLNFAVFGLVYAVLHSLIAVKLYAEKGRSLAVGFLWLSIGILGVAFAVTASIVSIATL